VDRGTGPRLILPADWGASEYAWSADGAELAIIRTALRPEPVRVHQTLWHLDRHGQLSKVYDSASETSILFGLKWSPGRQISFWESKSTSNSFAADGVLTTLHVVDSDTGTATDLGTTLQAQAWDQWSSDGRLAFVAGGDRATWHMKQIKVWSPDGRVETVSGDGAVHPVPGSVSAIAPAWPATYAGAALAWVEGPAADIEASEEYFRGDGPAAHRTAVVRTSGGDIRMSCPGMVTEGIRLSADATTALLLCRVPGVEQHALQIWFSTVGGTPRALVTGLGDLGFGFYGLQPSLLDVTAWSRADH
jgi:hypothetical protein